MTDKTNPILNGAQLVADFQSTFVSLVTSEVAKQAAEQSEQALLDQLTYASNGNLLQPQSLSNIHDSISHDSLDVHVKKVQAEQIGQRTQQLLQEAAHSSSIYKGRRVIATLLPGNEAAVEAVWFNPNTGERVAPNNRRTISGTIEEVLLDKNALIIRPSYFYQLVWRELRYYVVYVINPATGEPAVQLQLR